MKLKRLLTAALSAVMALSVCALPAMAEDATTAATPNPVWSQDHGSITIHKYEEQMVHTQRAKRMVPSSRAILQRLLRR